MGTHPGDGETSRWRQALPTGMAPYRHGLRRRHPHSIREPFSCPDSSHRSLALQMAAPATPLPDGMRLGFISAGKMAGGISRDISDSGVSTTGSTTESASGAATAGEPSQLGKSAAFSCPPGNYFFSNFTCLFSLMVDLDGYIKTASLHNRDVYQDVSKHEYEKIVATNGEAPTVVAINGNEATVDSAPEPTEETEEISI